MVICRLGDMPAWCCFCCQVRDDWITLPIWWVSVKSIPMPSMLSAASPSDSSSPQTSTRSFSILCVIWRWLETCCEFHQFAVSCYLYSYVVRFTELSDSCCLKLQLGGWMSTLMIPAAFSSRCWQLLWTIVDGCAKFPNQLVSRKVSTLFQAFEAFLTKEIHSACWQHWCW